MSEEKPSPEPNEAPRPKLRHASEMVALGLFLLAVAASMTLALYVLGRWALADGSGAAGGLDSLAARASAVVVLAAGTLAWIWGRLIEPRMLRVRRLEVPTGRPAPEAGGAVRLAFASDLHVEGAWHMRRKLVARMRALSPDAILLGGDYLNDAEDASRRTLEEVVGSLAEVAPVYSVIGNVGGYKGEPTDALEAAGARVLANTSAELPGRVVLHGIEWLDAAAVESAARDMDPGAFNVCLTHAPGVIPEAARAGFDLCLCGHTHGGQVRLPLWGALLTLALHGKRFESGRYVIDGMTAYVTRGVGLEGGMAPRVRFLCPPEVVLIEIERAGGEAIVRAPRCSPS
ncbi:MAG: metallophosphoesterase [Planctomycetota bacterium]|jgi:predicted MPP superfamily phosphohydrolase